MFDRHNQNEIARRPEQNLPTNGLMPSRDEIPSANPAVTNVAGLSSMPLFAPASTPTTAGVQLPTTVHLPDPVSTQFAHLVLAEAAVVRQTKPEVLNVLLKPDAQTEITVNLTIRGGQVEAQATFNHGSSTEWQARWADLQQTLSAQGVKLAPINHGVTAVEASSHQFGTDFGHSNTRQNSGQSPRNNNDEEYSSPLWPDVSPTAKTASVTPRRSTNPRRTFDSWA